MRAACVECVRKHVGAAVVAIDESLLGHPENSILAEGHLDQAASEVMRLDTTMAIRLRDFRRAYSQAFTAMVTGVPVAEVQRNMPDATKLLEDIQELSVGEWLKTGATKAP